MRINQLQKSQAKWEERAGKSIWSIFKTQNTLMYIIVTCNPHGTDLVVIVQGKFPLASYVPVRSRSLLPSQSSQVL